MRMSPWLTDRFAWTAVPVTIHWIVPILATVLFGAAIVGLFLGILVRRQGS